MIRQITQKEYRKLRRTRKGRSREYLEASGFLLFKGADNRYYYVEGYGMMAVKEWNQYNSQLKSNNTSQTSLFDNL